MPSTGSGGIATVPDRMRTADPAGRWSTGVAQWEGETFDVWLAHADRRLYVEKCRNHTVRGGTSVSG